MPAQVGNTIDTIQQSTVMSDNEICGCQKADGKPFSSLFTLEHFVNVYTHAGIGDEPSGAGSCNTWMPDDHETTVACSRHMHMKRSKVTSHFMHSRYHVCINTFAFLFVIGANYHIKAIRKHYLENNMEPRVLKNTKRLPSKTASYEDILELVKFL